MNPTEIKIWNNYVPGYIEGEEIPSVIYYPSENKTSDGTVIICPGGAYVKRAVHEGQGYAEFLNKNGIDAFVINYRILPYRFPYALIDARRAVRYVRKSAEKFKINPQKIAIMGSSAGGHLAALTCTYRGILDGETNDETDSFNCIPNLQILCYPVIDPQGHLNSFKNLLCDRTDLYPSITPTLLADEKTPKAFIWHTFADEGVDVRNTYRYAIKLRDLNISTEMHIYPQGRHGLGLDPNNECPYLQNWGEHLISWLKLNNFYL